MLLRIFFVVTIYCVFGNSRAQHRAFPPLVVEKDNWQKDAQNYNFPKVIELLKNQKEKAKTATAKDTLLRLIQQYERANDLLLNCKKVVFLDSLVIEKKQLLSTIRLTKESGKWMRTKDLSFDKTVLPFPKDKTAYLNALGNSLIFSASSTSQHDGLFSAFNTKGTWTTSVPLKGIGDDFLDIDYPFVLSDGITLYFSAKSENGIGGYDLFVTRYNPETRQYVQASLLPMPFNSTANDYCYAIDSHAGIGWLATDRNQPCDKVCIYSFLLDFYELDHDISHEQRVKYAQIQDILLTQREQEEIIDKTKKGLRVAYNDSALQFVKNSWRFVVTDDRVYTNFDSFKPTSRLLVEQWIKLNMQHKQLQENYEEQQREYARTRSSQISVRLQHQEVRLNHLQKELQNLSNKIRRLELSSF